VRSDTVLYRKSDVNMLTGGEMTVLHIRVEICMLTGGRPLEPILYLSCTDEYEIAREVRSDTVLYRNQT
jgi:hypothetical protein